MPSRPLPQSQPSITPSAAPLYLHRHRGPIVSRLLPPLSAATAAFSCLLILIFCFRNKLTKKRTVPSDSKPPHRLSYSLLRRATDSFSPSNRLGQGGFGSVFRGVLPCSSPSSPHQHVAVKVMDSGSLQGEREFYNELFFASAIESNDHVVSVLGFSSDPKRHRMLLVYELMSNGNLQDALLHKKCPELMEWKKRFSVAVDIAKAIAYLHSLNPPVIHGDIKPSNILLDQFFSAKIADFGLARLKSESENQKAELECNSGAAVEDCGSVAETESVNTTTTTTACEELSISLDQSPESLLKATAPVIQQSPEDVKVKEYVIEWIGAEIKTERPTSNWNEGASSQKIDKKKKKKRLDWWVSLDEDKEENVKNLKREKRRPAREWWKEEYCEELAKKKKKKKRQLGTNSDDDWWPGDEEMSVDRKKKSKSRNRSRSSKGSLDRWLEGLSGEFSRASGEIPKSGGITSTPSMRGTVCYVAPEYNVGGDLSEKSDVYSFGVLLLVLIAGRRPLQVTGSPMSEFQRANLISWARHLARAGRLIELVDQAVVKSLDREQALICITVALLCLQKSPAHRPSMEEVVGMLSGASEAPQLPAELSPSPPSRFPFKSRKRGPLSLYHI
ncbi:receptor-like serine/threonine-protein kinase At4g25390 isoform X1 [Mangifera indica]|uniref:receptor-like serine/threonine-protein kinase At4g25390 isoform X1 n=1 Tax=Mangifera indica TaxID=29780 RepID=UPI001CFB96A2|nr:receptor-like serine/threonine-protein kinase At4g25390 isoform X1 [Mangifera indica]